MDDGRSPLAGKKIVFVMGMSRSGTTWLQDLLAQHPDVATAQELHIFDAYLKSLPAAWDRLKNQAIGLQTIISDAEFSALCRAFSDAAFGAIQRTSPQATVLVEKTPENLKHWRFIDRLYPDAYFLCMVRDPRAVVASHRALRRSGWGRSWTHLGRMQLAEHWCAAVEAMESLKAARSRVCIVRYEELSAAPVAGLKAVFAALDMAVDEHECEKFVIACAPEKMRERHTALGRPATFVGTATTDGWRQKLRRRDLAMIETVAEMAMAKWGYRRATRGSAPGARALNHIVHALRWRAIRLAARVRRAL